LVALPDSTRLRELAYEVMQGFGDAQLGEWIEDRELAFHLRRRLTPEEEKRVGPAVDLRGTPEAFARFESIEYILPPPARRMAQEELIERVD
jgi:hypothetical protein